MMPTLHVLTSIESIMAYWQQRGGLPNVKASVETLVRADGYDKASARLKAFRQLSAEFQRPDVAHVELAVFSASADWEERAFQSVLLPHLLKHLVGSEGFQSSRSLVEDVRAWQFQLDVKLTVHHIRWVANYLLADGGSLSARAANQLLKLYDLVEGDHHRTAPAGQSSKVSAAEYWQLLTMALRAWNDDNVAPYLVTKWEQINGSKLSNYPDETMPTLEVVVRLLRRMGWDNERVRAELFPLVGLTLAKHVSLVQPLRTSALWKSLRVLRQQMLSMTHEFDDKTLTTRLRFAGTHIEQFHGSAIELRQLRAALLAAALDFVDPKAAVGHFLSEWCKAWIATPNPAQKKTDSFVRFASLVPSAIQILEPVIRRWLIAKDSRHQVGAQIVRILEIGEWSSTVRMLLLGEVLSFDDVTLRQSVLILSRCRWRPDPWRCEVIRWSQTLVGTANEVKATAAVLRLAWELLLSPSSRQTTLRFQLQQVINEAVLSVSATTHSVLFLKRAAKLLMRMTLSTSS